MNVSPADGIAASSADSDYVVEPHFVRWTADQSFLLSRQPRIEDAWSQAKSLYTCYTSLSAQTIRSIKSPSIRPDAVNVIIDEISRTRCGCPALRRFKGAHQRRARVMSLVPSS